MNNVSGWHRSLWLSLWVAEIYKWLLDLYDAHIIYGFSIWYCAYVIYELVRLIHPIIEGKQCNNAAGPPDHKFFLYK